MGHILIAGLGSIGLRHLTNLRALGWTDIRLYRTGTSTLPNLDVGVPCDTELSTALDRRPQAVIVSNPSALHLAVALPAAETGCHLLIEKPLSHSLDRVGELERVASDRDLAVLMGFQFRFHPAFRLMRGWIQGGEIGEVVSAHVHWGEHLPGMHPWEDYRAGYAARRELGGGALLTFCHPFDYLRWLLGDIERVTAVQSRRDDLGLDVDTSSDVTLRFASGACGHVHVDLVQRPSEHRLTIVGSRGTIAWSQADHAARLFTASAGRWHLEPPPRAFERNTMYLDEMRHFLACLREEALPLCSLADGRAALEVVLAAQASATAARSRPHGDRGPLVAGEAVAS